MRREIKSKNGRFRVSIATAASAAIFAARFAHATTATWHSSTSGAGQDWTTGANWLGGSGTGGIPGSSDVALFDSTVAVPNSGQVNLNFASGSITTGAIVDSLIAPQNLTLAGQNTGSNKLILNGATVTVPFTGSASETVNSTILSFTDTSSTTNKTFTLNSAVNIALTGATNNILGYRGVGTSGTADSTLPKLAIQGIISDATPAVHAGITFLGGGSATADGGELLLSGANTFSGGLTIGTADGTQGGEVVLSGPSALPTTGNITVYEQGQLFFGAGLEGQTFSAPGQTMVLNGIGVNKNISGAFRATGGDVTPNIWAGNLQFGSSAAADLNNGFVLVSVATKPGVPALRVTGNLLGNSFIEQGSGVLYIEGAANNYLSTQIGNGGIVVTPASSLGSGDVILSQTSTNNPSITLNNSAQQIGSLVSSSITSNVAANASKFVQNLALNGTTLTITQPTNTAFGYGIDHTRTSGINDNVANGTNLALPGSVVLNSTTNHTLTLTGPNTYTGATTINHGTLSVANVVPGTTSTSSGIPGISGNSATGTGSVTVNPGGILSSGGFTALAGFITSSPATAVTEGSISGPVIVAGGTVTPGGTGTVGKIDVGSLEADAGAKLNFDVNSPSAGNFDIIASTGALTLNGIPETVNIAGSSLTTGTFQLMTYSGLTLSNGGTAFTLGATPGGVNATAGVTTVNGNNHRNYSLATNGTNLTLTVTATNTQYIWSTNGSAALVDGSGTWQTGTNTNFFQATPTGGNPGQTYPIYDGVPGDFDTVFGNNNSIAANTPIALGSNITVGGSLILGTLASGSYTFGSIGGNNITIVGGVAASNNGTINAPVILAASQTFSADSGVAVTFAGGITESGGSKSLTKTGAGTLVLTGAGGWNGGTVITQGTLQTTTAGVPATGGISNSSILNFDQTTAGTYTGAITGAGSVVVSNLAATGSPSVTLSNTASNYTGATTITGGTLIVPDIRVLGTGDGGINLSGGTFKAASNLDFPLSDGLGGPNRNVTLGTSTTTTVDTNGNNITFEQNIRGTGNLTKIGAGTLTLAGVPSTTVVGAVTVTAGTLAIAPPANIPSFGFAGSATPNIQTGTIEVATPIELRLQGGDFSGGGTFQIDPTGILVITKLGTTTVGNNIVLNPNNLAGFSFRIGADTASTLALSGAITGNSDVAFTGGSGIVNLTGHSNYVGATTIDLSNGASGRGSVNLGIDNALPTTTDLSVTSSGFFDLNGFNQSVNSLNTGSTKSIVQNSSATNNSILTITGPFAASKTFNGQIQDNTTGGTLGLSIDGGSTLTLSAAENYSGPIKILNGVINITALSTDDNVAPVNSSGLGSTSSISIGGGSNPNNAQLRFNGITGAVSYLSNSHPFATPPVITLNSFGGSILDGIQSSNNGAIRIDNSSMISLPDDIAFAADSSIDVTSSSIATFTGNLSGAGTLNSLGAGTLTLTGANTNYTGGTTIQGGTFNVAATSALGAGPLQVNNTLNPSGSPTGTAVVLNLNNAAQSVGSLSGAIASTPVGNTVTINLASTSLTVNQASNSTFAGAITGTGTLAVNGAATLTIASTGSISVPTTVNGKLTFAANATSGLLVETLPSLTIPTGGLVTLADPGLANHPSRTVLNPTTFNLSGGKLDLTGNDLIVHGSTPGAVYTQLKSGFNAHAGYWNGTTGIVSTAAAGDTKFLTTLGYRAGGATFDTVGTDASDVLVKYTYYGDANIDGAVNGADYQQIDTGFGSGATDWSHGDFNYDGIVNGSDFALIDNAFNQITATSALSLALIATPANLIAAPTAITSAVPEPTTLGLLGIGASTLLTRRRRRSM